MNRLLWFAVIIASLAVLHRLTRSYIAGGVCTSKARMDGKTVIVTGANTGIGKETALDLAKRGARVIMACRDMKKGEAALKDITDKTGNTKLVLKKLDLASLTSIRAFAEDINKNEPEIHVLINNAGVFGIPKMRKTEDGFEMTMGINHLGHFLLTNLLLDLLMKTAPARIVVVSAGLHSLGTKEMKFDNINSEVSYDRLEAYSQSKLANILFTRELAKRLQGTGVTVNSLHPGVIFTEIHRSTSSLQKFAFQMLTMLVGKTTEQGAQTQICLAVSEEYNNVSGSYFADCERQEPSIYAQDDEAAKKLWEISADLVKLPADNN